MNKEKIIKIVRILDINGNVTYRKNNKNGLTHREGGPAFKSKLGDIIYYENGLMHRTDGPAYTLYSGEKFWYNKGILHNLNGPAIERTDYNEYYVHNMLHRKDGPAVECKKCVEYWIFGKRFYNSYNNEDINVKSFHDFTSKFKKEIEDFELNGPKYYHETGECVTIKRGITSICICGMNGIPSAELNFFKSKDPYWTIT